MGLRWVNISVVDGKRIEVDGNNKREIIEKLIPSGQGFRKVMSSPQRASAKLLNHWRRETKFNDHDRTTVCLGIF
jgi:Glu-tRNA(Gln) amidotransferase subunit E-like FAD-binding protein